MRPLLNILRGAALMALAIVAVRAQSLDPRNPTPLQPGVNASHMDAMMTPHYWTFIAGKGNVRISMTFRAQSILGAQLRTQVGFNIYDIKTPDKMYSKVLESTGQEVTEVVEGPSEQEHQMVIEVVPPRAIVRAGGDYQIVASDGVRFVGATAAANTSAGSDPIVTRRYRISGCNNDAQCGVRFLPKGAIALSGGEPGTWRLFDRERAVYVIVVGNQRQSLKLKPGVGLVQVQDEQMVAYQEVR